MVLCRYDEILGELHDDYINDENLDEGTYMEFMDRYIHCYFEPLVPEYDEARFSIYRFDRKFENYIILDDKEDGKKLKGIYLK